MSTTQYEIYNKETQEVLTGMPHVFGGEGEDSYVTFTLEDGEEITFANPNQQGQLENDKYLIRQADSNLEADGEGEVIFPIEIDTPILSREEMVAEVGEEEVAKIESEAEEIGVENILITSKTYMGKEILAESSRTVNDKEYIHIRLADGSTYDLTEEEYKLQVIG
jgi:hypothetical protein